MGVWCLYGALLDFGSETPWRSEGLSVGFLRCLARSLARGAGKA